MQQQMRLRPRDIWQDRDKETTLPTANSIVQDMIAAMWLPSYARILAVGIEGFTDLAPASLTCCYAVNTIYFWDQPLNQLAAAHRALQSGGRFIVAFIEKESGGSLPWTLSDFTFYQRATVKSFFEDAGFVDIEVQQRTEGVLNAKGQHAIRPFVIVSGQRL